MLIFIQRNDVTSSENQWWWGGKYKIITLTAPTFETCIVE